MNIKEIQELVALLEKSKLSKLHYKKDGYELLLEKKGEAPVYQEQIVQERVYEAPAEKKGEPKKQQEGTYVKSPMVGTFYASAAPDQPSYVKVGDTVSLDTVVCIIEAMKVMNEVKAGVSGVVQEIIAENGQPVEFGTKLFRVV